jgi:protein-tyrosine-phosphatase
MHREPALYPELSATVAGAEKGFSQIPAARRSKLEGISDHVAEKIASGAPARLTFICTHNSRRSHMAQIWAQTAAHHYGVPGVETFSGGTEATAFNPRAVAALERAGFRIETDAQGSNPVYQVFFNADDEPMHAFSKVYDEPPNPRDGFCAVMTCSQADKACPLVLGAEERIAIPYEDPKASDGTDTETTAYDERCRQIAREMLYLFSRVSFEVE